jgi:hypothetical protein
MAAGRTVHAGEDDTSRLLVPRKEFVDPRKVASLTRKRNSAPQNSTRSVPFPGAHKNQEEEVGLVPREIESKEVDPSRERAWV